MASYSNPDPPVRGVPAPEREAESTVALLRKLIDELSTLLRQELALARAEVTEALSAAKTGVTSVAAGGAVLFAAVLVLLAAAVLALALVLPAWLAAMIVGLILGAVGYGMLRAGQKRLNPAALKPTLSQESLRRDKEVLERKRP